MTTNERIKELRGALRFTQTEFGEKLGLKQNTVGQIENGQRNVTDRTIKLICSVFNANEEWLCSGQGEMFRQDSSSVIDQLTREYSLDAIDRAIVEGFLQLDHAQRAVIKKYIENVAHAATTAPPQANNDTALAAIATMQDYANMVADEKEQKESSSTSVG